jgi:3D (Asp-Asp-Asp) domain-containing protein
VSLSRRIRAGIALHAGVNVAFALGAVLSATGHAPAVASDQPLGPLSAGPPSGLPVHEVTTIPQSPLLNGPTTTTVAVVPPADIVARSADDAAESTETTARATTTTAATTQRHTTTTVDASRGTLPTGTTRQVTSTGYCLTGITASGDRVGPGMAAMNGVPLGTRWQISGGPRNGQTLTVTDRIGHGTEFDIWFPTCDAARQYGRRTITVELLG